NRHTIRALPGGLVADWRHHLERGPLDPPGRPSARVKFAQYLGARFPGWTGAGAHGFRRLGYRLADPPPSPTHGRHQALKSGQVADSARGGPSGRDWPVGPRLLRNESGTAYPRREDSRSGEPALST